MSKLRIRADLYKVYWKVPQSKKIQSCVHNFRTQLKTWVRKSLPPIRYELSHIDVAMSLMRISNMYNAHGEYGFALAKHEESARVKVKVLDPDPRVA